MIPFPVVQNEAFRQALPGLSSVRMHALLLAPAAPFNDQVFVLIRCPEPGKRRAGTISKAS